MRTIPAPKETPAKCPICEFTLRGTPGTGYRCVKCHAHYSTKFMRHLRRQQLSELLEENFGTTNVRRVIKEKEQFPVASRHTEVEEAVLLIKDDNGKVTSALTEAKHAAQHATQHLEDFLELQLTLDPIEQLKQADPTPSEELIEDEPVRAAPLYKNTPWVSTQRATKKKIAAHTKSTVKKKIRAKIGKKKAVSIAKPKRKSVTKRVLKKASRRR